MHEQTGGITATTAFLIKAGVPYDRASELTEEQAAQIARTVARAEARAWVRRSLTLLVLPVFALGASLVWIYLPKSATYYIERGERLLYDGQETAAHAYFAKAVARDPTSLPRINITLAEAYVQKGERRLAEGDLEGAATAFNEAMARDDGAEDQIHEAWVKGFLRRGQRLIERREDEAAAQVFAQALSRSPTAIDVVTAAWVGQYIERAGEAITMGKDEEARETIQKALAKDRLAAKRIDKVWVDKYIARGERLASEERDADATESFALATARDPSVDNRVKKAWIDILINRGSSLLWEAERLEENSKGAVLQRALASLNDAIDRIRRDNVGAELLGTALLARGKVYQESREYRLAISDFDLARQLEVEEAEAAQWLATNELSLQLRDEGQPIAGLLSGASNFFGLGSRVREQVGLRTVISSASIWSNVAVLHAELAQKSATVTACDRWAAHPLDPYRVAPGVRSEDLDSTRAIAACDEAVILFPHTLRLKFQQARSHLSAASNDQIDSDHHHAMAMNLLKGLMAASYPLAFSEMALVLEREEGFERSRSDDRRLRRQKESALFLELSNRVIHCCFAGIANYLLEKEEQYNRDQVRLVVHQLLSWAKALGNESAGALLGKLYVAHKLMPSEMSDTHQRTFSSRPPWLR